MRNLLSVTADIGLASLGLAALATFAGKALWIFDLASHFQLQYACAAAVLLVLNLILRRRKSAVACAALLGVTAYHLLPYYLPQEAVAEKETSFKVMLLNLNRSNQKTVAVHEEITGNAPDILVLQEVTPRWCAELDSLKADFQHSFDLPDRGPFGMWVLSKFPLLDLEVLRLNEIAYLHVSYQVDQRTLKLTTLHPLPPVSASASMTRNRILADAATYAAGEGTRIAIGDFNCSPWSPYFRSFIATSGLRDSGLGRGVHGTWLRGLFFGIPIDHILVSPDIEILDRQVGNDVGSDHRGVVLQFQFADTP
ncbi:MAG: endonuclease/exonuclease/phosphatase family protein [Verrucomicrobiales bacterium]